jgi:acyl-CoA synthetase (AMP-forming)/AMP-acid ligase II
MDVDALLEDEPEGLAALIVRRGADRPKDVFLEDALSDRTVDFGTLARTAGEWRTRLADLGVPAQGFVIVDVGDPLSFALAHLGILAAGRRSVPTNPDLSSAELERISSLVDGAAVVVTDRDDRVVSGAVILRVDALSEVTEESSVEETPAGSVLLFTSGSTGEPKGVELSERQLLFVARGIARHNGLTTADRGYNPLPLFHVNAEVVGLLATLVAGATLVLDKRFHRTGFWQLLEEREITWLNAVPAMLAVLARGGEFAIPDTVRFVRSASAPLPDAVRLALGDVPLVVSWGMTEGASQITATPLDQPLRDGSVGLPVGCEVQVRDEDGTILQAGEVGALWVRGPGIVTSYFRGRAAERFDDTGWLASGDLGTIDSDGWVSLVGRSDDVINRGGEKVYPAEVEEVLLGDERVREAVVVGRADPILHQVPVAYVIAADPNSLNADELIVDLSARCARELPRFKRPVEISIVDDVPRAPTGKVQRNRVRAMADTA